MKIGDYGMIKSVENPMVTKLGTQEYMAPELFVLEPSQYDGKAIDVFALGVNLFVIHTAKMPF